MRIKNFINEAVEREASDLHIVAGIPPSIRVHGEIIFLDHDRLTAEETRAIIYELLTPEQIKSFEEEWDLEFSFSEPAMGRFRASIYIDKGTVGGAFRVVPLSLKSREELSLPQIIEDLALKPNGLVLVTGATGMGKTTTLNVMIDLINRERRARIITIEDPIEFVHSHRRSIIIQREIDSDTKSFYTAVIHALRQDPNVLCVGEMRDLETISTALTAAETGHLVLSTLHTSDAVQTVDRIIDIFPPHQQNQVRSQLANCLQGIVCQALIPRIGEEGRALAMEVMVATPAVRNLIRENKLNMLLNVISTGSEFGMIDMDKSLSVLYENGVITYETALSRIKNPETFRKVLK
ncbi:MAG: type IV pilus twitching motility protein PilT [Vulcanimicrobiota bacterium]